MVLSILVNNYYEVEDLINRLSNGKAWKAEFAENTLQ
mgnify:CR=1 FL=1